MTSLPVTFWAKVDKTDTCWLWTAAVTSRGYGCFAIGGRTQLVHRLSYADEHGPIPVGLTIDHLAELCSSKLCVRPDHLDPCTAIENKRRADALITTCRFGHPLTRRPGDKQRRCQPCENERQRERRALARSGEAA